MDWKNYIPPLPVPEIAPLSTLGLISSFVQEEKETVIRAKRASVRIAFFMMV